MHLPPAATWEVGSGRWPRRIVGILLALAVMLCASFCFSQPWGIFSLILIAALGLAAGFALRSIWNIPRGILRWDGERWHWLDPQDHTVLRIVCVIDFQRLLLVHVQCIDGLAAWLWIESSTMSLSWRAVRRALVAGNHLPQ